MRLIIVAMAVAVLGVQCWVERDMAEIRKQCSDGYRATEHHDRLGGGGFGEDNRGHHWTTHRSLIAPDEEWIDY